MEGFREVLQHHIGVVAHHKGIQVLDDVGMLQVPVQLVLVALIRLNSFDCHLSVS